MDPARPDTLYVAFYQRLRRAYRFDSGGPDSGLFKSTDAGRTWRRLTKGLPAGDLGRIGLAISRSNPKVLMAIVENGFIPKPDDPAYADMGRLGTGVYRSVDGGETWTYVNRHNVRPFFFSQIRINPSDDRHVYVLDVSFWQSSAAAGRSRRAPEASATTSTRCGSTRASTTATTWARTRASSRPTTTGGRSASSTTSP
jgi:photosystem II stability/assembly factor-like uncharacterized protein